MALHSPVSRLISIPSALHGPMLTGMMVAVTVIVVEAQEAGQPGAVIVVVTVGMAALDEGAAAVGPWI